MSYYQQPDPTLLWYLFVHGRDPIVLVMAIPIGVTAYRWILFFVTLPPDYFKFAAICILWFLVSCFKGSS